MPLAWVNPARQPLLLLGLVCFAGGILLLFHHRRQWMASLERKSDLRDRIFEYRKFRRRAVLASMISSAGCVMAATYWLSDPQLWAMMMGVVVVLLVGIIGMGFIDLMSVGLRQISEPDTKAQQELVRKYLELREKRRGQEIPAAPPAAPPVSNSTSPPTTPPSSPPSGPLT